MSKDSDTAKQADQNVEKAEEDEPQTSDGITVSTTESHRTKALLRTLMAQAPQNANFPQRKGRKESYAFWSSQPVTQFEDILKPKNIQEGPIDPPKSDEDVRQTPLRLPSGYEWCQCDVRDEDVAYEVYKLLANNYVEDDDMMFRFEYSAAFLKWALLPPGFLVDWLVGVRISSTKRLAAFISAIPAEIRINNSIVKMVEINYLCVHKKLRSKRLAPVLIQEITRRVHLQDIWQATYTAGAVLPTPIARCRYWHRSLNPKKLIDIGFSKLSAHSTMAQMIKLYRLPDEPRTKGIRQFRKEDCLQVAGLLSSYLARFKIAPQMTSEDIEHWLTPRDGVVDAYVVENDEGQITDLTSFYSLPSSILGNPNYKTLNAAYMYYTVPNQTPLEQLMMDALIMAKKTGYDVFNALDILENTSFLKKLKFGEGDGYLQYYLYNWRIMNFLEPQEVGLILL